MALAVMQAVSPLCSRHCRKTIDAIAWDAPGYGQSTPLESPLPPRATTRIRWRNSSMRSTSLGGTGRAFPRRPVCGSFARHYPDRVSALALISPALGYGVAPGAPLPVGVQSRIDEIVELGPTAFAKKRAARLVGDPQARPEIVAAVQEAMGSVNPAGYVQAVHALGAGQFYGRCGSDHRSVARCGRHTRPDHAAEKCPFILWDACQRCWLS